MTDPWASGHGTVGDDELGAALRDLGLSLSAEQTAALRSR